MTSDLQKKIALGGLAIAAMIALATLLNESAPTRPNFLLILADDAANGTLVSLPRGSVQHRACARFCSEDHSNAKFEQAESEDDAQECTQCPEPARSRRGNGSGARYSGSILIVFVPRGSFRHYESLIGRIIMSRGETTRVSLLVFRTFGPQRS